MTRSELLKTAKPILFDTRMVKAILDGRKTQTRRVIKPRYKDDEYGFNVCTNKATGERWLEKYDENEMSFDEPRYVYPRYQIDDILYVRETWAKAWNVTAPNSGLEYVHKASCEHVAHVLVPEQGGKLKWRPSIHMPKEAGRLFLRVTDVRVERVQDIKFDDMLAEGISLLPEAYNDPDNAYLQARYQFADLWDTLYAKSSHRWAFNPWVWVYEFERMEVDNG